MVSPQLVRLLMLLDELELPVESRRGIGFRGEVILQGEWPFLTGFRGVLVVSFEWVLLGSLLAVLSLLLVTVPTVEVSLGTIVTERAFLSLQL